MLIQLVSSSKQNNQLFASRIRNPENELLLGSKYEAGEQSSSVTVSPTIRAKAPETVDE